MQRPRLTVRSDENKIAGLRRSNCLAKLNLCMTPKQTTLLLFGCYSRITHWFIGQEIVFNTKTNECCYTISVRCILVALSLPLYLARITILQPNWLQRTWNKLSSCMELSVACTLLRTSEHQHMGERNIGSICVYVYFTSSSLAHFNLLLWYERLFFDLCYDHRRIISVLVLVFVYVNGLRYMEYMKIKSSHATSEDLPIWMELELGYFQHLLGNLTSFDTEWLFTRFSPIPINRLESLSY